MDPYQKEYIKKKMPTLIKSTVCNSEFISILESQNILGESDVSYLHSIEEKHGGLDQAKKLYEIVVTRENGYEALLEALEGTNQTGSLRILQKIYDDGDTSSSVSSPTSSLRRGNSMNKLQSRSTISQVARNSVSPTLEILCEPDNRVASPSNHSLEVGITETTQNLNEMDVIRYIGQAEQLLKEMKSCLDDHETIRRKLNSIYQLTISQIEECYPGTSSQADSPISSEIETQSPNIVNSSAPATSFKSALKKYSLILGLMLLVLAISSFIIFLKPQIIESVNLTHSVASFSEFKAFMRSVKPNSRLNLTINISSPDTWREIEYIPKANQVAELFLEGLINPNVLFGILAHSQKSLKSLTLRLSDNQNNSYILNTGQTHSYFPTDFTTLEWFRIQSLDSVPSFIDLFQHLHFPQIRNFLVDCNFAGAELCGKEIVTNVVRDSMHKLQSLQIRGIDANEFDKFFQEFPISTVTHLTLINTRQIQQYFEGNLSKVLFQIAPNLQVLNMDGYLFSENSYKDVIMHEGLLEITIGVRVTNSSFDLSDIPIGSHLRRINLFLEFPTCDEFSDVPSLYVVHSFEHHRIENYVVNSNCPWLRHKPPLLIKADAACQ